MVGDAHSHASQAPGTITANDSRVASAFLSKDSRNYSFQAPASVLAIDHVGLDGSYPDLAHPYWVVVSFGDFDPSTVANIRSGAPGVPGVSPPVIHATVAYVIVDAVSGQYKGEEFKVQGCAAP
jgi:hypothetical protein